MYLLYDASQDTKCEAFCIGFSNNFFQCISVTCYECMFVACFDVSRLLECCGLLHETLPFHCRLMAQCMNGVCVCVSEGARLPVGYIDGYNCISFER